MVELFFLQLGGRFRVRAVQIVQVGEGKRSVGVVPLAEGHVLVGGARVVQVLLGLQVAVLSVVGEGRRVD